jgi:hypothetical protein
MARRQGWIEDSLKTAGSILSFEDVIAQAKEGKDFTEDFNASF